MGMREEAEKILKKAAVFLTYVILKKLSIKLIVSFTVINLLTIYLLTKSTSITKIVSIIIVYHTPQVNYNTPQVNY